tara:strand:- start:6840 stop:7409 length:570 start_codon:yes stop_codon:yes gene_type:complete
MSYKIQKRNDEMKLILYITSVIILNTVAFNANAASSSSSSAGEESDAGRTSSSFQGRRIFNSDVISIAGEPDDYYSDGGSTASVVSEPKAMNILEGLQFYTDGTWSYETRDAKLQSIIYSLDTYLKSYDNGEVAPIQVALRNHHIPAEFIKMMMDQDFDIVEEGEISVEDVMNSGRSTREKSLIIAAME